MREKEKEGGTTLSTYYWKKANEGNEPQSAGKYCENVANTRKAPEAVMYVSQKNSKSSKQKKDC